MDAGNTYTEQTDAAWPSASRRHVLLEAPSTEQLRTALPNGIELSPLTVNIASWVDLSNRALNGSPPGLGGSTTPSPTTPGGATLTPS